MRGSEKRSVRLSANTAVQRIDGRSPLQSWVERRNTRKIGVGTVDK
ncbi:hypothetical protein [Stenomitos frigidus]|nr:hypothetical protein [Stenomitos frigidus]